MQIEILNPNPSRDPSRKPMTTERHEEFGWQLDDAIKEIDDAPARPEQTAPGDRAARPDQTAHDDQAPVPDGANLGSEPTAEEQPAVPGQPANLPAETSFEPTVATWTAQDTAVEATPRPIVVPESTIPSTVEPTVPAVAGSDPTNGRTSEPVPALAPAAANPTAVAANGIEVSHNAAPQLAGDATDNATGGRRAELNQLLERHLADRPGLGAQVSAGATGSGQASPSAALGFAPGQSTPDNSAKGNGLQALLGGAPAGHAAKPAPSTAAAPATAAPAPAPQQAAEPIVDIATNVVPTAGPQAGTAQAAANVMAPQQGAAAQPVAQQVAVQIARASEQGVDRFRIRLDPPELGRVDVRLELSHEGRVQVVISAERSETLDLLRRDVLALERALAEAGLETDADSLRFSERGEQGDDDGLADAPGDGIDDDPDRAGGPGEMPPGAWVAADGALDIRV